MTLQVGSETARQSATVMRFRPALDRQGRSVVTPHPLFCGAWSASTRGTLFVGVTFMHTDSPSNAASDGARARHTASQPTRVDIHFLADKVDALRHLVRKRPILFLAVAGGAGMLLAAPARRRNGFIFDAAHLVTRSLLKRAVTNG